MTAHHVDPVACGGLRAGQRRDDVDDLRRARNPRTALLDVLVECDIERAACVGAAALELRLDPAPCRADATEVRFRVRQRVPRMEAGELADCRFDASGRDRGDDRADLRVACEHVLRRSVER